MTTALESKPLSRRKLKQIVKDPAASAAAVQLHYVCDSTEGIIRIRQGGNFIYKFEGKEISDEKVLNRIQSLVLPPAWDKVWICKHEAGHLQATGIDAAGRKQYRYHPVWNALRSQTKFVQLTDFGRSLPDIRNAIRQDLSKPGLPQEKVLALLIEIMLQTGIRIGNNEYEKLYGSIGLTTLKNKHVQFSGTEVKFHFKGKKGVIQDISLRGRKLANAIRKCREIPGKELFQYYTEDGGHQPLDSGDVNNYIKTISGGAFTAKDFRTWTGSLAAIEAFRNLEFEADTAAAIKRNVNQVLDEVAQFLGNTRTVCKKYYVHPAIIELYENGKLQSFLSEFDTRPDIPGNGLKMEEELLLKILAKV